MGNDVVQIKNCVFCYNNDIGTGLFCNSKSVVKIIGLIRKVFINECNFCNNSDLTVIRQVAENFGEFVRAQGLFHMDIFIAKTNFSMTDNRSVIDLQNANLYLIGPVVFHNNHCTSCISDSVIHVHKSILSLTDYVEFSANKADTIIRYKSNT